MKKLLSILSILCLTTSVYGEDLTIYDDEFDIQQMTFKEYYQLVKNPNILSGLTENKIRHFLTNTKRVDEYIKGMKEISFYLPVDNTDLQQCIVKNTMLKIDYDESLSDKPVIQYVRENIIKCIKDYNV